MVSKGTPVGTPAVGGLKCPAPIPFQICRVTCMNRLHAFSGFAFALAAGIATAQSESTYEPTADDLIRAKGLAANVIAELAGKCPVKPVNDMAALRACRDALFSKDSVVRSSLKSFVLWGRPPGGDINASLKDFRSTQFGPEVLSAMYLPIWMWDGSYEFDYRAQEKSYRVTAGAGFRNELDFGQYPYPFWQDPKKWTDYEDANTISFWIDPKSMKISQLTFYRRVDKSAVAKSTRRHMPTFDGKWMWVDDKGQQQPAPTLFVGLFSAKNPHLDKLDSSYKKLALALRDADCASCHVPNNPDKMRHLVLLQTPLHAASEIERVIRDVKRDRMPLDEIGMEKPLDEKMKARFLADAEDFAAWVKAARDWEAANPVRISSLPLSLMTK